MKIRDLIVEVGTAGSVIQPTSPTGPQGDPKEVNKLTAMVSNLQKQVQDLQKSALQTSSQLKSGPGSTQQPQQATAPSTIAPVGSTPPGQQTPQQAQQKPGQTPNQAAGTPAMQPNNPSVVGQQAVPGVAQPAQITNMKIKQDLSRNQGQAK